MICKHENTKIRIQENQHDYPFSFKFEECLDCGEMIKPSVALREKYMKEEIIDPLEYGCKPHKK